MVPNNHPRLVTRLEQLLAAVKRVYASTFSNRAKAYLAATHYRPEEEKMAVIIQRVVGDAHGDRFYPDLAGSARSYNYYPAAPATAADGIAAVALGLGETVAQNRACVRFSPRYPHHVPISLPSVLDASQKEFYAVDLRETERFEPRPYDLTRAEADGTLGAVASTYSRENDALFDGVSREGVRVVTFAPVLKHELFPLAGILDTLLSLGREGTQAPVELEFAVNLGARVDGVGRGEFGFLQIRPLVLQHELEDIDIGEFSERDVVCHSERALGNGRIDDVRDAVVVDYHPVRAAGLA